MNSNNLPDYDETGAEYEEKWELAQAALDAQKLKINNVAIVTLQELAETEE